MAEEKDLVNPFIDDESIEDGPLPDYPPLRYNGLKDFTNDFGLAYVLNNDETDEINADNLATESVLSDDSPEDDAIPPFLLETPENANEGAMSADEGLSPEEDTADYLDDDLTDEDLEDLLAEFEDETDSDDPQISQNFYDDDGVDADDGSESTVVDNDEDDLSDEDIERLLQELEMEENEEVSENFEEHEDDDDDDYEDEDISDEDLDALLEQLMDEDDENDDVEEEPEGIIEEEEYVIEDVYDGKESEFYDEEDDSYVPEDDLEEEYSLFPDPLTEKNTDKKKSKQKKDSDKPGFIDNFKEKFSETLAKVKSDLHGGDNDNGSADKERKAPSPRNDSESPNKAKALLLKVLSPYIWLATKIHDLLLKIISKIPKTGQIIGKITKPLKVFSYIVPIVLLLFIMNWWGQRSIPSSETLIFPDGGRAEIYDSSYDDGMVSATIENTGDVVAELIVSFDVYGVQPSVNPYSIFGFKKLGECEAVEPFSVKIGETMNVSFECDSEIQGMRKVAVGQLDW